MATHTDADPQRAPVPPGWPGDDPTLPEELSALGHVPAPPRRRPDADTGDRGSGADVPGRPTTGARRRLPGAPAALEPDEHDEPDDHGDAEGTDGATTRDGHADGPDADGRDADGTDPDDDDAVEDAGPHTAAEPDGLGDHELDAIAGIQPAGRVLVVMVAALLLAVLVNADALVDRAERRPPGAARDRALAIWHPVQDVSHVLQLHRIRDLADRVAGDGDEPAVPVADRDGETPETGTAGPGPEDAGAEAAADDGGAPFALRTPTAAEPLRLLVGGDFTAQALGDSLVDAADATGLVEGEVHVESASGLTRPDYFDWPAALEADVEDHEPEVLVVVFGANDAQGIVRPDGTPVQVDDPGWAEEYGRRVGALMDQVRADDRMVVWVGQPPMRGADYAARMAALNGVYAAQAAGRPWVTFVDPATVIGGAGGAYAETVPGPDGAPIAVRQADGIHLAPGGGGLLATHVLRLVGQHVDLNQ